MSFLTHRVPSWTPGRADLGHRSCGDKAAVDEPNVRVTDWNDDEEQDKRTLELGYCGNGL